MQMIWRAVDLRKILNQWNKLLVLQMGRLHPPVRPALLEKQGMVAYCSADGTVCRFQLTTKGVEKDPSKHRAPHFACGSLSEDESAIVVGTPLPDGPLPLKRLVNDVGNNPKSKQPLSVSNKAAKIPASDDQPLALCYGDDPGMYDGSDETLTASKRKKKPKSKSGSKKQEGEDQALTCIEQDDKQKGRGKDGAGNVI